MDPLLSALQEYKSISIEHKYLEEQQTIIIKGTCENVDMLKLSKEYLSELDDLNVDSPRWPEGIISVVLFILTYCIFEKANNERE